MNNEPLPSKSDRLRRMVQDIYATRPDELQYDQATRLMERCAADLLSEAEVQRLYPQLWRYFELYPQTKNEYTMLVELAHMDAAGKIPKPVHIPPAPQWQTPTEEHAGFKDVIRALFPGFLPLEMGLSRQKTVEPTFAPVSLMFGEQALSVECEIRANLDKSGTWDLFCTVAPSDATLNDRFEFSLVWLEVEGQTTIFQEREVNALGDLAFEQVSPGSYTLHLNIAGQEYAIANLQLPSLPGNL